MNRLRATVLLTVFYIGITGNLGLRNWLAGLLVSALVVWLVKVGSRTTNIRRAPVALMALLRYIWVLIVDLMLSGIQVAKMVLNPNLSLKSGIIQIPSEFGTELGNALNAHAITLTPGELVVETGEDGSDFTHCLDATHQTEIIQEAQLLRHDLLDEIFK